MGRWLSQLGCPPQWLIHALNNFESKVAQLGNGITADELLELQDQIEERAEQDDIVIYWFGRNDGGMKAQLFGRCYGNYLMPAAIPKKNRKRHGGAK